MNDGPGTQIDRVPALSCSHQVLESDLESLLHSTTWCLRSRDAGIGFIRIDLFSTPLHPFHLLHNVNGKRLTLALPMN